MADLITITRKQLEEEIREAKEQAWAEGAQYAWESTGEGWNHEYANGNGAHPVFPDLDDNPHKES